MDLQARREQGISQENDVEDLQQTSENQPTTSEQNTLDVPGTSVDHQVAQVEASNVHIGDIHTEGPVFNAPITMEKHTTQHNTQSFTQHNTQNITQHNTQNNTQNITQHNAQHVTHHISIQQAGTSQEPDLKTEVRQKCEELKSALKEKVKSIANEESSLANFSQRPITPVNLSMVSKPQQIDDEFQAEGHFHRRKDFAKIYDRPTGDITPEQLFDRSKQQAEEEAERKFREYQVKAKQEYIEKHGNTVAINGNAGMGKTTLMKKSALQALEERTMYGSISFFFYIVVRFINFKTSMTFLQFLLHTMLPGWNCNLLVANEILKVLSSDPNIVVFVDGLDEAAFESFSTEAPAPLLEGNNKPEVYLKNLAGGKLLPRARKIFTSRPAPFYKLHPSHRPQFVVQILGLTKNSQRELGQQLCGERYNSIEEKLEQNTNLFAYCYVPVNFILTVHYLLNYDGDIQFVSLSHVLAFTCVQYSQTRHLKDHDRMLDKLAKMAWNGFKDKRIVFSSKDFKNMKIKDSTADAFLNTSVTKKGNLKLTILDGHKLRYFSHLIWQEFFAAVYLMMIMPLKEFKKVHKKLTNERWEVVAKFAFGICDLPVFNELEAVVSESSRKVWYAKKSLLRDLALSCMEKQTKEEILRCCSWAHEANDEEITSSVSSSLPDHIDFRNSSFLPTDIKNISFVIARRIKPLKKLYLSRNKIGDRGAASIGNCIHNMEEVDLRNCNLTNIGAELLSKNIKELKTLLKKIDLSRNKIRDRGAASIGNCIHNMEEVYLAYCGLTCVGAEHLSKNFEELETPLKKLDLSGNEIGDRGATSIGNCIHNMEEVDLVNCGLINIDAENLSRKIKELKIPLKKLDLSNNKIGDRGAASIGNCIHNMEEVDLSDCNLTNIGVEHLSKNIKELKTPLKKLDLSNNKIGDQVATSIGNCIHNLEEVDLSDCNLTNIGAKHLSKNIKELKTPLKKLDLSGNKIGDRGAASIGNCIHNMEEVDLRDCNLTNIGVEHLSKNIKELKTPLKMLDLSENEIGDRGAASIGNCIHIMEEVDLRECSLTNIGVEHLSKNIKELKTPMKVLDLSWNVLTDKCAESLAECVHNIERLRAWGCGFTQAGEDLIRSKSRGKVFM